MKDKGDMADISGGVARLLRRLGMGDVRVLMDLQENWDEIAGRPWAEASRPMGITGGELAVEAFDPGVVSMLRYATGSLVKAVEERIGSGHVDRVRVIAPPAGGPR
jgi:hypothetical protein